MTVRESGKVNQDFFIRISLHFASGRDLYNWWVDLGAALTGAYRKAGFGRLLLVHTVARLTVLAASLFIRAELQSADAQVPVALVAFEPRVVGTTGHEC